MGSNPKAFERAKAMAEGIQPHPYSKIGSRSLEGWGDNVQPPRPANYHAGAKGPIDPCTMGGRNVKLPKQNLWKAKSARTV